MILMIQFMEFCVSSQTNFWQEPKISELVNTLCASAETG